MRKPIRVEISVDSYLFKQYALIASKCNFDTKELRKEIIKANKDFEKREHENLYLYDKLTKKIEDNENKQS